MKISEIRILRGIHVETAAQDLAFHLKDIDVIFIEWVKCTSWVKPIFTSFHGLSKDPVYIERFGESLAINLKDNFPLRVAWELRGTGKLWMPVDLTFDDEKYEEELEKYTPGYDAEKFFKALLKNPDERYRYFNSYITHMVKTVHERDKLVVKQVSNLIEKSNTTIEPYFTEQNNYKVAVVQGYLHHTKDMLHLAFPEATIRDVTFNKKLVEHVKKTAPLLGLAVERLRNPNQPLSNKKIDQVFLCFLEAVLDDSHKPYKSKYAGMKPSVVIKAVTAQNFMSTSDQQNSENFEKIERYDENELLARIEARLTELA